MPYKDPEKRRRYHRAYMKRYRQYERRLLREYRLKVPNIDAMVRKELGFIKDRRKGRKKK